MSPTTSVVIGIGAIAVLVIVNMVRSTRFQVRPDHDAMLERLKPNVADDDTSEPGTPEISPATEERIRLMFAPQDQARVRVLLRNHVGDRLPDCNPQDIDRIRLAVLKLSNGKLDKLEKAVHAAKIDWRDVLR